MIIITNRELPIHINAEYEDWLFWGIYEDKDKAKIPEIYKEAIKELTDRNDKYQKKAIGYAGNICHATKMKISYVLIFQKKARSSLYLRNIVVRLLRTLYLK